MFDFLLANPILIVVTVLLFMAFLVIVFLKPKKKKQAKVEKVFAAPEKKEQQTEATTKSEEQEGEPEFKTTEEGEPLTEKSEEVNQSEIVTEKSEIKKKQKIVKSKEKPKIEQVFKREKKEDDTSTSTEISPDISEEDLLGRMQFVKSSKKISKLRNLTDEEKAQQKLLQETIVEEPFFTDSVSSEITESETKKPEKPKHFDHTRRISRCIECGSVDELFCPHLSERYLNINTDRHLRLDDNFEEALFARTTKMLANSGAKMLSDQDDDEYEENYTPSKSLKNDKEYMKEWLEKRRREEFAKLVVTNKPVEEESYTEDDIDDINLSVKNLLIARSVMKRKSINR